MIDTHAHFSTRFGEFSLDQKIEIDKVILAASNIDDSKQNIGLATNNPKQFFASVGIHPESTDDFKTENVHLLENLIVENKKNIVAVGECGLDYFREKNENQRTFFIKQIELAQKYNLPLIVHARKAVDEAIEILKNYKNIKGVFHCYAGGRKRIQKILDLGENWYFGIDGNITYEEGLVEVVKNIPKDRLLLETDSPYLTPIPHRGELNKPDYIEFIYQKVAEIWEMSFEETEKIVDQNAKRLFEI